MEIKKLDQKEYLKRYLSKDNDDKKKKKKKLKVGPKTVQIIDDDIDLKNLKTVDDEDIDIHTASEYAPQIVGIIDERGSADFDNKNKWKVMTDEDGDISISKIHHSNICNSDKEKIIDHNKHKSFNDNLDKSSTKKSKLENRSGGKEKNLHKRQNSDSDLSPPRTHSKQEKKSDRNYCERDSKKFDVSPSRHKKSNDSPSKSRRRSQDSDLSPPRSRNNKKNRDDSRKSSKHLKENNDSDSDLSPPRKEPRQCKSSEGSDSDFSLPRNKSYKKDKYNRKSRPNESPKHKNSKPNKTKNYDSDLSPPRNSRQLENKSLKSESQRSKSGWDSRDRSSRTPDRYAERSKSTIDSERKVKSSRWNYDSKKSPEPGKSIMKMRKALDGTSAGLQNSKSLKEEEEAKKKREADMMKKMSRETSGFGQETIVRDRKTGRKRNFNEDITKIKEREKEQEAINEKYAEWGRGLKQNEARQEKLKRDLHEMSKPLARYVNDTDLDRELREVDRDDDPMLNYIKKKRQEEIKNIPQKPEYKGSYMPNRFGIKPGCRWDGVDRSNGYERKWFEARASKKALEEEAFKWSSADM